MFPRKSQVASYAALLLLGTSIVPPAVAAPAGQHFVDDGPTFPVVNGTDPLPTFGWLCPGGANGVSPSMLWAQALSYAGNMGPFVTSSGSSNGSCALTTPPGFSTTPPGAGLPASTGPVYQALQTPVVAPSSNNASPGWVQQTAAIYTAPPSGTPTSPPVPVLSTSTEGQSQVVVTGSVALDGTATLNNGVGVNGTGADAVSGQTNTGTLTLAGNFGWTGNGDPGVTGPVTVVGTGGNTMVVDNPAQPNQPPPVPPLPPAPPVPPYVAGPVPPPLPPSPPVPPYVAGPPATPPTPPCGSETGSAWGCAGTASPTWGGGTSTGSSWGTGSGSTVVAWGSGSPPASSWGDSTAAPVSAWGTGAPPASSWGDTPSPPVAIWGTGGGTGSSWG